MRKRVRLPAHISEKEFADSVTGTFPLYVPEEVYKAQQYLFEAFEYLRKTINEPITILSAYRTPVHQLNLFLHGTTRTLHSAHIFGVALDLKPHYKSKLKARDFYHILIEGGYSDLRIGIESYGWSFMHIDSAFIIKELALPVIAERLPKEWHRGARW